MTALCNAFEVHRSSYKYWLKQHNTIKPTRVNERVQVKTIFTESRGSAGARTIARIATQRGYPLSRYRAGRLMKQCDLMSTQLPSHTYKNATQAHLVIPNHLNRAFNVTAPNQVWCGDVTSIWSGTRWAYLAIVMDLFARQPIGWAL